MPCSRVEERGRQRVDLDLLPARAERRLEVVGLPDDDQVGADRDAGEGAADLALQLVRDEHVAVDELQAQPRGRRRARSRRRSRGGSSSPRSSSPRSPRRGPAADFPERRRRSRRGGPRARAPRVRAPRVRGPAPNGRAARSCAQSLAQHDGDAQSRRRFLAKHEGAIRWVWTPHVPCHVPSPHEHRGGRPDRSRLRSRRGRMRRREPRRATRPPRRAGRPACRAGGPRCSGR